MWKKEFYYTNFLKKPNDWNQFLYYNNETRHDDYHLGLNAYATFYLRFLISPYCLEV